MYERSSCADSSCAFDWATAAAACSYCPCASSRSFCDSAFCCGERLGAREVGVRDVERGLIALQRGRCAVDLRLERLRVHPEQHLARLDHGAFGVDALVEEAGHPRRDVDRLRALRLRDEHRGDRHVARGDRERGRLRRAGVRLPSFRSLPQPDSSSIAALSARSASKARAGRMRAQMKFMGEPSSRCGQGRAIWRRAAPKVRTLQGAARRCRRDGAGSQAPRQARGSAHSCRNPTLVRRDRTPGY